jgi:hypothetical protein
MHAGAAGGMVRVTRGLVLQISRLLFIQGLQEHMSLTGTEWQGASQRKDVAGLATALTSDQSRLPPPEKHVER